MKKNFARKVKRIKSRKRNREIRASYWGWCKWGDCKNLWRTITNNDMSFADKGIKQSGRTKDGKKFFDVKETRLMDEATGILPETENKQDALCYSE